MPRLVIKIALCLSLCFAALQSFSQRIYWTEPGSGRLMYGTYTATAITGQSQLAALASPNLIAIDPGNSRIFYSRGGLEDLYAIDMTDGSSLGGPVITTGGMVYFETIAYSENQDAIYGVMNEEPRGLRYVPANNNDADNDYDLPLGGMGSEKFLGAAVDDDRDYLYFTSDDTRGIYYTDLSGSSANFIGRPTNTTPEMVAVDKATGTVYFTAQQTVTPFNYLVYSFPAGGGTPGQVANLGSNQVFSLKVDSRMGRLYYVQDDQLLSMPIGGTVATVLVTSGVRDFALEPDFVPPYPVAFTPVDNAVDVSINPATTITFDSDVVISTASGGTTAETSIRIYRTSDNFQVVSVPRTSSGISIAAGGVVTLSPSVLTQLDVNTAYHVQIGNKVFTDLSGNPYPGIINTTNWNFTTMPGVTMNYPVAAYCGASTVTLPDIVITETRAGNIAAGTASIFLEFSGTNSSFKPGVGSISFTTGKDLANASVTVTATRVNITLYVSTTTQLDQITISGLEITATAPTGSDYIIRNGGTGVIAGLKNSDPVATLTPQVPLDPPIVAYPASNNHYCKNATVTGTVATVTGTNTLWYSDAGMTSQLVTLAGQTTVTAADLNVDLATAGTYSVYVTQTPAACESTPTKIDIIIDDTPTPAITGGAATACVGESVTYTTENSMSNYVWTVTGGAVTSGGTATSNEVTVTWNTPGAHTVVVNYTNASGCAAPSPTIRNVTVNDRPAPAINGTDVVCQGATGLAYSTLTGKTDYQWTVSAGGTITAGGTTTSSSVTVTWATAGARTVSLNYTDNGCAATAAVVKNVTVNARPVPTLDGLAAVCVGSADVTYTTESLQAGYSWSVTGGTITSGTAYNLITVTWPSSGSRSVSVNYTDANGCTAVNPTSYAVQVVPAPSTAIAGAAQALCAGAATLDATAPVTGTGQWTADGTGGVFANDTDPKTTFTGTRGTDYTLTWTTSNSPCTPSTSTVQISLAAAPTVADAGIDQQPCALTTILAGNTPAIGTGTWSVINGAGGNIATQSNPASSFSGNPGIAYTLRWTISTGTVCPPSTKDVGIVFIEPPTTAQAGADLVACGTATTLAANVATSGTGTWSVINGTGGTFNNPASPTSGFDGVAGNIYTLRWTIAKTGCTESTDDVSVQLSPIPGGQGTVAGLAAFCPGVSTSYQVSGITDASSYEWTLPPGFELVLQSGNTAQIQGTGGASGTLSVRGINNCGSSNAATLPVSILPEPQATINLPANAVVEDELQFSFTSAAMLTSPGWSFGDDNTSMAASPTHAYTQPGDYAVSIALVDATGCQGQAVQTLHVSPEAELSAHSIKNVVTANGDDSNGVLYIDRIERFPDSEVVVLDRWGVEVFRRTQYANDWDFRKGEEYVPAGNYICLVKYQGKVYSRSITVLKAK